MFLLLIIVPDYSYALSKEDLFKMAFGKKKTKKKSKYLYYPIYINDNYLMKVKAKIYRDFNNRIKKIEIKNEKDILKYLKEEYKKDIYIKIEKLIKNKKIIKLKELQKIKINIKYNDLEEYFKIIKTPQEYKTKVHYLKGGNKTKKKVGLKTYNQKGFLLVSNLKITQDLKKNKDKNNWDRSLYKFNDNFFINYKDTVLNSSLLLQEEYKYKDGKVNGTENNIYLGDTYITKKLKNDFLLELGDINTKTNKLSSKSIAGFKIEKNNRNHNPKEQIYTSVYEKDIFLERPSKVEIYTNDNKIKELKLEEGNHKLYDFILYDGFNEIELKITDDLNNVKYIKFEEENYTSLLKPGGTNYGFSIGIDRKVENNEIVYNNEDKYYSLFYNRGFEDFIFNLDYFYKKNYYTIGNYYTIPTKYGTFKLDNYQSFNKIQGKKVRGQKNVLSYNFKNDNYYINYIKEYKDKKYTLYTEDELGDEIIIDRLNTTYFFGEEKNKNIKYNKIITQKKNENITKEYTDTYSYSQNINEKLSFDVNFKDFKTNSGDNEKTITFNLVWNYNKDIKMDYKKIKINNKKTKEVETIDSYKYTYQNEDKETKITNASTINYKNYKDKTNTNILYNHKNQKYYYNSSYNDIYNKEYKTNEKTVSFSIETAFLYLNNNIYQSKPIYSSFVLFENKNKDKKIKNISIDGKRKNQDKYIISLNDYDEKLFKYNKKNLPIDYELMEDEINAKSYFKTGIYVPINIVRKTFVRGYLEDENGILLKERNIKLKSREDLSFTNKKGRFIFSDIIVGKEYYILADNKIYKFKVDANNTKRIVKLGVLKPEGFKLLNNKKIKEVKKTNKEIKNNYIIEDVSKNKEIKNIH